MITEQEVIGLNGDEAVAYAAKQCKVDVVAAYPITPQTIIVEKFSEYVANGEVETEFITVESEHSALSACVGASAVGARVFTATAANGLALMHEIVYVASGLRLPIVMVVVNRALSSPINIHCDHGDSMAERDAGWIQIYTEDAQEAYDTVIQGFRIAEDERVLLPVMVMLDGFFISHTLQNVFVLPDETVKKFVGEKRNVPEIEIMGKRVKLKLDPSFPLTIGPLALYDYYHEIKRGQAEAINSSMEIIKKVHDEYSRVSGRKYGDGVLDSYKLEDAEIAIVCIGSAAGTVKSVVNEVREEGLKAGCLRIRVFRPFPADEIRRILSGIPVIGVLDRSLSFGGMGGPLQYEIKVSMYDEPKRPLIMNYAYGLGGRDLPPGTVKKIFYELNKLKGKQKPKETFKFIDVRE